MLGLLPIYRTLFTSRPGVTRSGSPLETGLPLSLALHCIHADPYLFLSNSTEINFHHILFLCYHMLLGTFCKRRYKDSGTIIQIELNCETEREPTRQAPLLLAAVRGYRHLQAL